METNSENEQSAADLLRQQIMMEIEEKRLAEKEVKRQKQLDFAQKRMSIVYSTLSAFAIVVAGAASVYNYYSKKDISAIEVSTQKTSNNVDTLKMIIKERTIVKDSFISTPIVSKAVPLVSKEVQKVEKQVSKVIVYDTVKQVRVVKEVGFNTVVNSKRVDKAEPVQKNDKGQIEYIKVAMIGDMDLKENGIVNLRLLEPIEVGGMVYGKNTSITGHVTKEDNRYQITVSSIKGNSTNLKVYEHENIQGLTIKEEYPDGFKFFLQKP